MMADDSIFAVPSRHRPTCLPQLTRMVRTALALGTFPYILQILRTDAMVDNTGLYCNGHFCDRPDHVLGNTILMLSI